MGTMPYSFRNKFGKYLSDPVKAVNVLSLFYLVYIAFLIASSLLPEPFSEAAGAMAWLLPMLLFFPFMLTPDVPRDTGTGECTASAPGFSFGRRAALVTLIFLLPALLLTLIFKYGPMGGVLIAFQDYNPIRGILGSGWVGLEHFQRFLSSPDFMTYLVNTLKLSIYGLLWGFPIPILLAFLLNRIQSPGIRKKIQLVLYLPNFISVIVLCGIVR